MAAEHVPPHIIARRDTADGARVSLWTDGDITLGSSRFGARISGLGMPRSRWARSNRVRSLRLIMDDISSFDLAEIPKLVRATDATWKYTWASPELQRVAAYRAVRDD